MISYIKYFNSNETENEIRKERSLSTQVNTDRFINSFSPLIDSGLTIPYDNLVNILKDKNDTMDSNDRKLSNENISSIIELLRKISINDILNNSHILGDKITASSDDLEKEYNKFSLESKMKFPYSINLYSSNVSIISFFNNIKKIISDLNYIAYVSDSKSEIDSVLKQSKHNLATMLDIETADDETYRDSLESCFCDATSLEQCLLYLTTPYFVDRYFIKANNSFPNNPFTGKYEYIEFLINPYKYKLNLLEHAKGIFDKSCNLLLTNLYEGGINLLQKTTMTYRSKDIIELFVICYYILHLLIEYVIRFSRELHDVSSFIHNEISTGGLSDLEAYIPPTVHEMFNLLKIESEYSRYSSEAEKYMSMKQDIRLNEIDESYKRKWAQLQKAYIKIFKVGISKIVSRANSVFFKKYYGRIPHLYSQYADRATVVENTMVGDPGEILSTVCVKYVEGLANDSTELFNQLLQLAGRITSTTNVEEKINVLKSYCKKFKPDKDDPDKIRHNILNETRYRIASSILRDNEIYGFTVDGILQNKKFPPANHIVTSLFVRNPHEKPQPKSVRDIFGSEKYILQFAHPENLLKFNNLYRQSSSKIIDTFNPKMASVTEKNLNKANQRLMYRLNNYETADLNMMKQIDPKEQKKISNDIDKALIKSIDMVIAQKRRCLQCAGIAHNMIGRVTELAKRCVVEMLNVEKELTDIKKGNKTYYNSGNKMRENKGINKRLEANKRHIDRNTD
jgi:hypothetical protein